MMKAPLRTRWRGALRLLVTTLILDLYPLRTPRQGCLHEALTIEAHVPVENDDVWGFRPDEVETVAPFAA